MANIVNAYEVWDRDQDANEQISINSIGPLQIASDVSRKFYIETINETISQVQIYQEMVQPPWSLPDQGAPHPHNPLLFALNRRLNRTGMKYWILVVRYESVGATENPVDEPPTWNWRSVKRQESIDQDRFKKAITNAADESYDPPLQREFSDWLFTYSQNVAQFNTAFWSPLLDGVNSDVWRGFPPYTAKIGDVVADSRNRGGLEYFRITISVQCRNYFRKGQNGQNKQLGWIQLKANKGFRTKNTKTGGGFEYRPILDAHGMPIRTPVFLTADGSAQVTDPNNATWREHEVFDVVTFSTINQVLPGFAPGS